MIAKGYENSFKFFDLKHDNLDVQIDLYFYNNSTGFEELAEYYTKNFERIFNE